MHWVMPFDISAVSCEAYPCWGWVDYTILFHFKTRPQRHGSDTTPTVRFELKAGNPRTHVTADRWDRDLVIEGIKIRKVDCHARIDHRR
jgi:hypothetical protein